PRTVPVPIPPAAAPIAAPLPALLPAAAPIAAPAAAPSNPPTTAPPTVCSAEDPDACIASCRHSHSSRATYCARALPYVSTVGLPGGGAAHGVVMVRQHGVPISLLLFIGGSLPAGPSRPCWTRCPPARARRGRPYVT